MKLKSPQVPKPIFRQGKNSDSDSKTFDSGGSVREKAGEKIDKDHDEDQEPKEQARDQEIVALIMCVGFFFIIAANYLLQSFRDAQVLYVGKHSSARLLSASAVFSLFTGPLAKNVAKASIYETSKAIQMFYRVFGCIVLLGTLVPLETSLDGQKSGFSIGFCSALFVVTQSLNSMAISILWSFSSDLFPRSRSVKFFSMFGAACTIGQAVGSLSASTILLIGPFKVQHVLYFVAIALECAGRAAVHVGFYDHVKLKNQPTPSSLSPAAARATPSKMDFGSQLFLKWSPGAVLSTILSDGYVRLICIYTLCYTMTLSLVYLERTSAVADIGLSLKDAASLSAQLSFIASLFTFAIQIMLATETFSKMLDTKIGLFALPLISSLGFTCILLEHGPRLTIVTSFELCRRVVAFAVAKPVRESLYSLMPREQRFSIKPVMDSGIYRLGMGIGALLFDWSVTQREPQNQPGGRFLVIMMHAILAFTWIFVSTSILQHWLRGGQTHSS